MDGWQLGLCKASMKLSEQEDIKEIREGLLAWRETSASPKYEESLLNALARLEHFVEKDCATAMVQDMANAISKGYWEDAIARWLLEPTDRANAKLIVKAVNSLVDNENLIEELGTALEKITSRHDRKITIDWCIADDALSSYNEWLKRQK